jgi:hypothetical protein
MYNVVPKVNIFAAGFKLTTELSLPQAHLRVQIALGNKAIVIRLVNESKDPITNIKLKMKTIDYLEELEQSITLGPSQWSKNLQVSLFLIYYFGFHFVLDMEVSTVEGQVSRLQNLP